MSYVMVDVETDGEIPGDFSMISLGAVIVRPGLADTFYGQLAPISDQWNEDALKISGHTRAETLSWLSADFEVGKITLSLRSLESDIWSRKLRSALPSTVCRCPFSKFCACSTGSGMES
jgi:hypothetical protein